jgi:hypothetical protein
MESVRLSTVELTPKKFKALDVWDTVDVYTKGRKRPMVFKWLKKRLIVGSKVCCGARIWADDGYYYVTKDNVYRLFFSAGKLWIGRIMNGTNGDCWVTAEASLKAIKIETILGVWKWH